MATVFSKIISGEFAGKFAYADDQCVVFASIGPITDGHMLVVPRQEIAKYTDAPDDLLTHLILVAKRVGLAVEKAFDAPRAALLVAGFEVPHLHLHVLPAWNEQQLSFANAGTRTDDQLIAATEKVRSALRDLGYGQYVPADIAHL
jgi:diadenosine tetraphosphate (Ap4A) HIT family hydrolase